MKRLRLPFIILFLALTAFSGCFAPAEQNRSVLPTEEPKHRTIMVYLNGSDLETKHQAGTIDLLEMAHSGFDEENINLIVFTGGTKNWHLPFIPDEANTIFQVTRGHMTHLADAGQKPMGDPAVLAGFIDFCIDHYPAEHYSLIFWNHGGGAISGFGYDERFGDDPGRAMMKLREIDQALAASAPPDGFEFIGFDTCLMANLEIAAIARHYADYLVASSELEPVDGWDYTFLGKITPDTTTAEIGRLIIDYYERFYEGMGMDDILTLSLTDLGQIDPVYDAFEALAQSAGDALALGAFHQISKTRAETRAFGAEEGVGPDMIDLAQLAEGLHPLFPDEAKSLLLALDGAVIYAFDHYPGHLGGLAIYFPYANKADLDQTVSTYLAMGQLPQYSRFVSQFAQKLLAPPEASYAPAETRLSLWITPGRLGLQAEYRLIKLAEQQYEGPSPVLPLALDGHLVSAFEIARNPARVRYAIPVTLDGEESSLIAVYDIAAEDIHILGAVPTGEGSCHLIDKKVTPLTPGSRLIPRYLALPDPTEGPGPSLWLEGEPFILGESPRLEPTRASGLQPFFSSVDTQQNSYYKKLPEASPPGVSNAYLLLFPSERHIAAYQLQGSVYPSIHPYILLCDRDGQGV